MSFYYDRHSGQAGISQYLDYLRNDKFSQNPRQSITYRLTQVKSAINRNTVETRQCFEKLTTAVCGTLERGFGQVIGQLEDVNWRLNDMNANLQDLHTLLDWKTDAIIEQQRITNLYLGNVSRLLKIPDSQKQRAYHVEQGLNYLQNALMEGAESSFFSDALDEFLKSEQIESKDYFTLHKLGLIHLNSITHLDISRAENYFLLSAKYAKALARVTPTKDERQNVRYAHDLETSLTREDLIREAASATYYASCCNYILGNTFKAVELIEEVATVLAPENVKYNYQRAKFIAAQGKEELALQCILYVLNLDYSYFLTVLTDQDFLQRTFILNQLQQITADYIFETKNELGRIKAKIADNSSAKPYFTGVENILIEPTYMNARKVKGELQKQWSWEYKHYFTDRHAFEVKEEKRTIVTTVERFVEIENKEAENLRLLDAKWKEKVAIAEQNLALSLEKQKREARFAIAVLIMAATVIFFVGIWIWNYSSNMAGWFTPFLVKLAVIVVPISALVLFFAEDDTSEKVFYKFIIPATLIIIGIRVWMHASTMDGWFASFLIKAFLCIYFLVVVSWSYQRD